MFVNLFGDKEIDGKCISSSNTSSQRNWNCHCERTIEFNPVFQFYGITTIPLNALKDTSHRFEFPLFCNYRMGEWKIELMQWGLAPYLN